MSSKSTFTTAEIREIERIQIHERGTPGYTLMCRAGQAAYEHCLHYLSGGGQTLILTGPGNNGGDGYVVARLLREAGYGVTVISLSDPGKLKGDALLAKNDYLPHGEIQRFNGVLPETDLIVDAILGTGLERPLTGDYLVTAQLVNDQNSPVIALDIPTGLNSDSGTVLGSAIRATETITFIGMKQGLVRGDGATYCGKVTLADLGVDADLLGSPAGVVRLNHRIIGRLLPPRQADCHKGDFGHAMLVGGNAGYAGAIRMAAESAARCGSGLVTVFTHPEHAALVTAQRPEIMSRAVAASDKSLLKQLELASCIGFGPGLGTDDWAGTLFDELVQLDRPMVVDADALNWLAKKPEKRSHWILTPHPGEAGRLLGSDSRTVQADRPAAARALQERFGGIVILKGFETLIYDGQTMWQNAGGNPGMATGGMGDVLTGTICGLLSQLKQPLDAALCGVAVHTLAADLAAGDKPRGLLAMDVINHLREAVNPKPDSSERNNETHRV